MSEPTDTQRVTDRIRELTAHLNAAPVVRQRHRTGVVTLTYHEVVP